MKIKTRALDELPISITVLLNVWSVDINALLNACSAQAGQAFRHEETNIKYAKFSIGKSNSKASSSVTDKFICDKPKESLEKGVLFLAFCDKIEAVEKLMPIRLDPEYDYVFRAWLLDKFTFEAIEERKARKASLETPETPEPE